MSDLRYIEHEGQLYRGFSRSFPTEVWSRREQRFVPYKGIVPKDITWGNEITEADAVAMMDEAADDPAESDDATFWTVAAKHPFVIRLSPTEPAAFYNRRTGRWHLWNGTVPPCGRMVTRAEAWKWLRSEQLGLDFGTIERPFRLWPEPAI